MASFDKELLVKELTSRFQQAEVLIFTKINRLSAMEMNQLRRKLNTQAGQYLVVKNRLAELALKNSNLSKGLDLIEDSVGIAISKESPESIFKSLVDFNKDHPALDICGALTGEKLLSSDCVKAIAALPSREVLLASVVRGLNAPVNGLVNALSQVIRKFVIVLDKIRKKQEKQGG
ncbi:MAG: 50S ribosomal protein L10 [Candidatus Omnitrophota bacterium]|nr:50S ribosomal protein L10 [Candidatus Omnitrophota bacterium]